MSAFRALFSLLATFLLVAASSTEASASERQWQAGLSAGYAQLINGGGTAGTLGSFPGFGTSLSLSYGITDAINIIGRVDMSVHPGKAPVLIGGGGAGIAYVLDILRWVPWLGVTVDGYGVSAREPCVTTNELPCTTGRLGFSGMAGLDYQLNRRFSLGGTFRYGLLLLGNQNKLDQTISGFLRAQYIWGY
jgi:hypothetical protein